MLLGVLFTLFIGVVACSNGEEPIETTDNSVEQLGMSAFASVGALNDMQRMTTMSNTPSPQTLSVLDDIEVLDSIDELQEYLDLVRTFTGDESFDVNVEVSEMEAYDYVMAIQFMSMEGNTEVYYMHYNETIVDEDEDDEEFDSIIEGILEIDGETYQVYGEREVELEEEEFEFRAYLDDDNYVTVSYEFEDDGEESELELVIEMYMNNQLVKRVEIEFEEEYDELELELKFVEGTLESTFEFEIETDGNETTLDIEYKMVDDGTTLEEGEIEILIVYNEADDTYTITYTIETSENKSTVIEESSNDNDDDDNDDDDDEDDEEDEEDDDNDDEEDDEENNEV